MLYSILPPEAVWEGFTGTRQWRQAEYRGIPLLVEERAGGPARLERLLSTDPQDYLDPGLQPGLELKL